MIKVKAPMLADLPGHIVHEGKDTAIARPTGQTDKTEMTEHSAQIEIPKMKIDEYVKKHNSFLEQIADQFAESQSKHMFDVIAEATDKTGNVVDGKGQPFSEDLFYQALEKMWHSFDASGEWQAPTLVVHPELYEKIMKYDQERTPEERAKFQKRLDKLIQDKKAQYDSEQAGRILAG